MYSLKHSIVGKVSQKVLVKVSLYTALVFFVLLFNNHLFAQETYSSETSTTALVATGEATAQLDAEQQANTNTTFVDVHSASTTLESEENVENAGHNVESGLLLTSTASTSVIAEQENIATTTTQASVVATTGENSATSSTDTTIQTGDAESTANVVNIVNTNVFNSTGMFYFLNMILGNIPFDARNLFSILSSENSVEGGCSLDGSCTLQNSTFTIQNTNTADVHNTIELVADTGNNTAYTSDGSAGIYTGDAYASANVVNLVNTNITDTNYLLVSVNGFSQGSGNIIFPGADWFYELLSSNQTGGYANSCAVQNTNEASIMNTGSTEAETGMNTVTSNTDATVHTGDAYAQTNIVNTVNTNIIGDSLSLLFTVQGNWTGEIFGLPDGMVWKKTDTGFEIVFDSARSLCTSPQSNNVLNIQNTNTATIHNNISVLALTGQNEAHADGTTTIETGDAYASANVVNIVNTNILGRNWVLALFNIFGDWDGNISFGQPDLWIGARAHIGQRSLRGGSCFTYELTIKNFGDADAHNVLIHSTHSAVEQTIDGMREDVTDGRYIYMIGTMYKDASVTVPLPVCLAETVGGNRNITTAFEVTSIEDDADLLNNRDVLSITTVPGIGGPLLPAIKRADFSITKTVDQKKVIASSSVTYTITIQNGENPIYNALLVDTMYDEANNAIHEQRWGLDSIGKNETIVISYDTLFSSSTMPGIYINEALISGTTQEPNARTIQEPLESPIAKAEVLVLEHSTRDTPCSPLLSAYLFPEYTNPDDEVGKLQFFLKVVEGFESVALTKEYDDATIQAVHAFQTRYADDVLAPWGMQTSSGYLYITTQKKINELWCDDMDFSLSTEQLQEIDAFKHRQAQDSETEENEETGENGTQDFNYPDIYGYLPESRPVPYVAGTSTVRERRTDICSLARNTPAYFSPFLYHTLHDNMNASDGQHAQLCALFGL